VKACSTWARPMLPVEWVEIRPFAQPSLYARRSPSFGATSQRFTLLAVIGSRPPQVVADDERTKEKGEDDVPPPPPPSTPPLISAELRVRQASTE
jgi:hypothetical protein